MLLLVSFSSVRTKPATGTRLLSETCQISKLIKLRWSHFMCLSQTGKVMDNVEHGEAAVANSNNYILFPNVNLLIFLF